MQAEPDPNHFPLFIHGHGSVSTAGVDSSSLYRACIEHAELPPRILERSIGEKTISYLHRPVNAEALKSAMPKHPRLRRASNVTKFAVTAAHQAIGAERLDRMKNHELNIGIVLSFMNGCVNYSNRFYEEVLKEPSLASPMIFPETVFNAPASHIAAFLDCDGPVYTLIGDTATWFSALAVAEGWIAGGLVDGCLILCAEEIDWLTLEALSLYSRDLIATEGAAAIYVEASPSPIAIESLHGPFGHTNTLERREAIQQAWEAEKNPPADILVDGLTGVPRFDRDEHSVTNTWSGKRLSPARVLGEGMGIRSGFQTIAAIEALHDDHRSATILASGGNQHAFSARLSRHSS